MHGHEQDGTPKKDAVIFSEKAILGTWYGWASNFVEFPVIYCHLPVLLDFFTGQTGLLNGLSVGLMTHAFLIL